MRTLPWKDRVTPPPPADIKEFYEGADAAALAAGYHEGATWYELDAFRAAVASGTGEADVTLEDGILSVALGAAAHRSIATGRPVTVAEIFSEGTGIDGAEMVEELRRRRVEQATRRGGGGSKM